MHAWVVTRLYEWSITKDEKKMIRVEYWRKSYFETLNLYNLKCINSSTRTTQRSLVVNVLNKHHIFHVLFETIFVKFSTPNYCANLLVIGFCDSRQTCWFWLMKRLLSISFSSCNMTCSKPFRYPLLQLLQEPQKNGESKRKLFIYFFQIRK